MKDENKLNVRMLSDVCMQSRLLKEALVVERGVRIKTSFGAGNYTIF